MFGINDAVGLYEHMRESLLAVHQDRCVAVRNRNAACRQCVESCPNGCISYADNRLQVAFASCAACGACASACPTSALVLCKPTDVQLLESCKMAMARADGRAVIMCEQMLVRAESHIDPSKAACVKCLARVDESLLVSLAALGARSIHLVCDDCDSCALQRAMDTTFKACESASIVIEAWGHSTRIDIAEKLPAVLRPGASDAGAESPDERAAGRRSLLSDLGGELKSAALEAAGYTVEKSLGADEREEDGPTLVRVDETGVMPRFMPERRITLGRAIDALGEPKDVMFAARLWGHVAIDVEKCDACRLCTVFCPTGALSAWDSPDGEELGLVFYVDRCLKCGVCSDVCRKGALQVSREVFAVDVAHHAYEQILLDMSKSPFKKKGTGSRGMR